MARKKECDRKRKGDMAEGKEQRREGKKEEGEGAKDRRVCIPIRPSYYLFRRRDSNLKINAPRRGRETAKSGERDSRDTF